MAVTAATPKGHAIDPCCMMSNSEVRVPARCPFDVSSLAAFAAFAASPAIAFAAVKVTVAAPRFELGCASLSLLLFLTILRTRKSIKAMQRSTYLSLTA